MKTLRFLVISALLLIAATTTTFAQKIGVISSSEIYPKMPEFTEANTKFTNYQQSLQDDLANMNTEFQKKYQDFLKKQTELSDALRKDKESELNSLSQRIQDFQQTAQEDLANKEQEYFKPVLDKLNQTIQKVGNDNGFTIIMEKDALRFFSPSLTTDVTPLVVKALGL